MSKRQDAASVTAERVAALIEAPETPPVMRELLALVCVTIDCHSAAPIAGTEDFDFRFPHVSELTPAQVRRQLPRMLRKVGAWHSDGAPVTLYAPSEKAQKGGDE
jgi:hypothetical protein